MLKVESTSNVKKEPFINLNLTLEDSGLVFICGKKESSSKELQKLLAGITYNPDIKVSFDEKTIESEEQLEEYRLQNVGFVFENSQIIENDTVLYNSIISTVPFSEQLTEEKINEVLTITKLIDKKDVIVSELSELELHLLDIARALMKEPKIIYANNPIARLTDAEAEEIWQLLKEISKDHLVIVGNALVKTAEKYANKIISFSNYGDNNSETIEITDLLENKNNKPVETFNKNSVISFAKAFQISLRVLKNKLIVILLMAITMSVFLYGSAIKNDSHLKFAKALKEAGVKTVFIERQNDKNNLEQYISKEFRDEVESISSSIEVKWSHFLSKEPKSGYEAHSNRNTKYRYPDSLYMLENDEVGEISLLYGAYNLTGENATNQTNGVYLSKTEAENYLKYYQSCTKTENFNAFANKIFQEEYLRIYPDYNPNSEGGSIKQIATINDLVGEYIIFAFSTYFTNFRVAGIYEDSEFEGRIFLTENYQFAEGYNRDNFFSLGVVTLSDNLEENAKLLSKYASVVRNEREVLIVSTTLDAEYDKLYSSINKIPGTANLVALIFLVLTICGSAVMSFLIVSTYRNELVLARTYGLNKKETYKVSLITNAVVALISTATSIVIVLIASLVTNTIIKDSHTFISFNFVYIPVYGYLIALLALVLLTLLFTFISINTLKKKDCIVY